MKTSARIFSAVIALLLALPLASASCAPFLQVAADESKVVARNEAASFTVVVGNTGPNPQAIAANTLCNSAQVSCSTSDFYGPVTLASGAATTFHISASSQTPGNYSLPLQVFGGTAGSSCLEERTLSLGVTAAGGLPTPTATQAPLSVTASPTRDIAAQPGETIEFTLVVQNNLPDAQFVQILYASEQGNFFAESTFANAEQFRLASGDGQAVSVQVAIPPGTPGGVYSAGMKVRGTSSSGNAFDHLLAPSIFVFSPTLSMQWASTPASCLQAFHGNEAVAFLTARNLGETRGPFEVVLEAPGEIAGALKLSPSSFELNQREAKTISLSLNASKLIPAGEYAYAVKVKYLNSVALRFDSCASLRGLVGIDALPGEKFGVVRGSSAQVFFSVANNGSLPANYSVDYNPLPLAGTAVAIEPANFRLSGGRSQTVKATILTNATAPLGEFVLPLTLRASNQSRQYSLVLSIVSSNKTGQSPLEVVNTHFRVVEGAPVQFAVAVRNNGFKDLESVLLAVEGLPVEWVRIETPSQPIARSRERDFLATFTLPPGANQQRATQLYAFTLHAVAGLESVSAPALLEASAPVKRMAFAVEQVRVEKTPEGSKLLLRVAVYNEGNVPLSGIQPSMPFSSEYLVTSNNPLLRLGPGGREYVELEITPTTSTKEQDVFLRLQSGEGVEKTGALRLPALSKSGSGDGGLGWKAVAAVVLIIAIMAALGREDIEQMLRK